MTILVTIKTVSNWMIIVYDNPNLVRTFDNPNLDDFCSEFYGPGLVTYGQLLNNFCSKYYYFWTITLLYLSQLDDFYYF